MKNYYAATIKLQGESNCKRVMDWIEENNFPILRYTFFQFDIGRMFMVSNTEEPWWLDFEDKSGHHNGFEYYPCEVTKSWIFGKDNHWYFMDTH